MSWEAAGAIGEIIGAAAAVVSLIYLAPSPAHEDIWVRAHEDFDSLSPLLACLGRAGIAAASCPRR